MKDLMDMLGESRHEEGEMTDAKKQAKMEVLMELIELAKEKMGESVSNGLQEVTVAAPDKESLMEGMDKAQALMGDMPDTEGMEYDEEDEDDEEYMGM